MCIRDRVSTQSTGTSSSVSLLTFCKMGKIELPAKVRGIVDYEIAPHSANIFKSSFKAPHPIRIRSFAIATVPGIAFLWGVFAYMDAYKKKEHAHYLHENE
eukprot:TRINITY_DN592_c0_g1_i1.p1 TRINITY_DN592_c0_g1~~TRINITY_DN592_c0_g1_i1.p1  ORF type:complete len:101 (-),score=28.62 TRINITY_DN592_c0_g1_i1:187-489(-)